MTERHSCRPSAHDPDWLASPSAVVASGAPVQTSTLYTPRDVAESELAAFLEQQFEAGWFPDHHRCSIETEDAVVFVDFDPAYFARLPPDEQGTLAAQLGFAPKVALHVSSSSYHAGSPGLAEAVLRTLCQQFGGRSTVAA